MTELSPWLPLGAALFSLGIVSVLSSHKRLHSLHGVRLAQVSRAAIWGLSLLFLLSLWVGFDPENGFSSWAITLGGTFVLGLFAKRSPSEFSFWSKKRARYIYLLLCCGAMSTLIFLGLKPSALLTIHIVFASSLAARNHRLAVNGILSDLQISQSKLLTHIAKKNHDALKIQAWKLQSQDASIPVMTKADAS